MLYMIIERYLHGDALPVYRRFRERGRMAPEGLSYVGSWVTQDLTTCYQVMECDDERLLTEWMPQWEDVLEFEYIPVMTSGDASAAVSDRLNANRPNDCRINCKTASHGDGERGTPPAPSCRM